TTKPSTTTEITTQAVTLPSTTVVQQSSIEEPTTHLAAVWKKPTEEDYVVVQPVRDINNPELLDRKGQSSMVHVPKDADYMAFENEQVDLTSTEVMPLAETVLPSLKGEEDKSLSRRLQQKLDNLQMILLTEQLKKKHPDRFAEYLAGKVKNSFPITREETATAEAEVLDAEVVEAVALVTPSKPKTQRAQFFAKRINFSDNNLFVRKPVESREIDIRRQEQKKPKQVTLDGSASFANKARFFLNNINSKSSSDQLVDGDHKQINHSAEVAASPKGCSTGHVPVWLSFGNTVGSEFIDSTFVNDLKTCKGLCADESCHSFTYFNDAQCMINVEDGGVHLRRPPRDQHGTRTDLKFCYPGNIEAYHDCATFVASRDHTLTVNINLKSYPLSLLKFIL
ncbi:unnamed protein product, partial [Strongylus vulgaris]